MIQLQVLNRVLTDGNLNLLIENNFNENYFSDYKEEYNFIFSHYKKYNKVPDDETMLDKFQDFELLSVGESEKYLVETLREDYLYQQVVPVLNRGAQLVQEDSVKCIQFLLPKLQELMQSELFGTGVDISKNTIERLSTTKERMENPGSIGISTGLPELDEIIGGWAPGEELAVILGRVNQGKSWILQFFLSKAWQLGKSVLLYSGEMSNLQVGYRFDTLISNISNRSITRGKITKEDFKSYESELKRIQDFKVPFIVVTPKDLGGKRLTASQLDMLIEKYRPDIVGIDQLSLMEDERGKRDVTRIQMTHLAEDLFRLSEKYSIPILADAQAKRKQNKDDDKPYSPELDDISESDGVGQNASKVISLVQAPTGLILSVKKNRNGENNRSLNYCWDIDKGIFTYLPEVANDDDGEIPSKTNTNNKPKPRRSRREVVDTFGGGSEAF